MAADAIFRYHERSKHHEHRYARSPGAMDWANQPHPFRHYSGAPVTHLPFLAADPPGDHADLYRHPPQPAQPPTLKTVGAMLELSLGISAWKAAGSSKWALRMNPSSGNLHPIEAHLVLPSAVGIAAGIYHYCPLRHALEQRAALTPEAESSVFGTAAGKGFFLTLTSIFWRESWKYGERAWRYCQLDAGHALAAVGIAANLWGWRTQCRPGASDADIRILLGFDQIEWPENESEEVVVICWIDTEGGRPAPAISGETRRACAGLEFAGRPSTLSPKHMIWSVIDEIAAAVEKPATPETKIQLPPPHPLYPTVGDLSAAAIIRRRRSATAFVDRRQMPFASFMSMLEHTLPRRGTVPFDTGMPPPAVNLFVFVHRVEDVDPGLYALIRCPEDEHALRRQCRRHFEWSPITDGFPLYRLTPGDFRSDAIRISCHQDIAGFGVFSLGMIARFEPLVASAPYRYRHLFWEAGMIGQVLYLEAEAAGFRGTGIGCFFDDAMHHTVGLSGHAYQSLYHFTVGTPVEDRRLTTLPGYHHLNR